MTRLHDLIPSYLAARRNAGRLAPSSAKDVRRQLCRFADSVADYPAEELTAAVIERWLEQPNLMASTRRRLLTLVRGFCRWMVREGHLAADPTVTVERIRVPQGLPRALTDDQVDELLAACPDRRARLIVSLEVRLGLRAVEVVRLRVEHVDPAERTLVVTGKGSHQRRLPVPDDLWELLAAEVDGRSSGPLIRNMARPEQPLTAPYVTLFVNRLFRAAGVDGSGHALRHTFAGRLVRSGVDVATVQQLLGHSNLSTTSRYLTFEDPARLRAAVTLASPPPATDPTLSVLVDVVADLAAKVAAIDARVDRPAVPASPSERNPGWGPPGVRCRVCDVLVLGDTRHCPDCGGHYRNLGPHRRAAHGAARRHLPAGCGHSARPHDHTTAETCVCPDCDRELRSGASEHLSTAHTPCPDCDRAFISLGRHRRQVHRWELAA